MTLKEPAPASRANGATTGFTDFGAVPLDTRGASPPVILLRHRPDFRASTPEMTAFGLLVMC